MNQITLFRKQVSSLRGATPEALALSIALGLVLGVFPAPGLPTLLCALAAGLLRLNAAALQAVNYISYPLQLALLAPFISLGEVVLRGGGAAGTALRGAPALHAAASHWTPGILGTAAHAVAGWFCLSAPAGLALYLTLTRVLRRRRSCGPGAQAETPARSAGITA